MAIKTISYPAALVVASLATPAVSGTLQFDRGFGPGAIIDLSGEAAPIVYNGGSPSGDIFDIGIGPRPGFAGNLSLVGLDMISNNVIEPGVNTGPSLAPARQVFFDAAAKLDPNNPATSVAFNDATRNFFNTQLGRGYAGFINISNGNLTLNRPSTTNLEVGIGASDIITVAGRTNFLGGSINVSLLPGTDALPLGTFFPLLKSDTSNLPLTADKPLLHVHGNATTGTYTILDPSGSPLINLTAPVGIAPVIKLDAGATVLGVQAITPMKLQVEPVPGNHSLAIDLVPTDTGIYDPFKVDAMAEFLGFDHFNFSQSVVETYSGVPMNQAVCELSPFGAHVIGKIDPKTGQIDPTTQKTDCDALKSATGTYVGGVLHDDPINGGGVYWTPAQAAQNPGSLTDCPNAPQGARFSFVDSLVGVDKLGKVTPIGQMGIPWITGTDFVWHYDGADGWDAPLGVGPFNAQCHEIGAVFPTILEASSVVGIGVGTSTFDRFINFADLPVTQQTKVAEPFSLAVFVLGLLGLGYIRVTSHRGRFFDGGAHPMEFQPSSI